MKVKRISRFLAIVFAVTLVFGFSSCSQEEEESVIFTYSANGNISGDMGTLFSIAEYNDAIKEVLGASYSLTERDKDVIVACDAVYSSHKKNQSTLKGSVEIEKSKSNASGEIISSVVIKTYKYE